MDAVIDCKNVRPEIVEARQLDRNNPGAIVDWIEGAGADCVGDSNGWVSIQYGVQCGEHGDWFVRDAGGAFSLLRGRLFDPR